ncbi:hypothetical protein BDN67DRAFT_992874 [Paxillus ammoniavirescens]|nr:hypothetical protein BDN67DRAFT_992874 [Paxillus ammoniavirescens]
MHEELECADRLFLEWGTEFETIYCEHKTTWIHFVRQSIHALRHYGNEVVTKGPVIGASQWTMERMIGNLTEEIRQPSNPYANLSQQAIRRAQVNALKTMLPSLDPTDDEDTLPQTAKDMGDGYILLKFQDRTARPTTIHEGWAIHDYIECHHPNSPVLQIFSPDGTIKVVHWARIRLPNGQIGCSRNVQITLNGTTRFAEVRYYFEYQLDGTSATTQSLAVLSLYSLPDPDLLERSTQTYISCSPLGDVGVIAVNIKSINHVIAMIPEVRFGEDHFYMAPRPGADVAYLSGYVEREQENEDN